MIQDFTIANPIIKIAFNAICKEQDVDLLIVPSKRISEIKNQTPDLAFCPFATAAISFNHRQLFTTNDLELQVLVHELGHITASALYPGRDWDFLGWEFAVYRRLAKLLKVSASAMFRHWRNAAEYEVYETFGTDLVREAEWLDDSQLVILVKRMFRLGQKNGNVSQRYEPVRLR